MVAARGRDPTRLVDAGTALHERAEAMLDADEGRLPEAETKLDALVQALGADVH